MIREVDNSGKCVCLFTFGVRKKKGGKCCCWVIESSYDDFENGEERRDKHFPKGTHQNPASSI